MCCCFCCCQTRFSLVIYMLITTSLAFIFGIVVISNFGSNTDVYKYATKEYEYEKATSNGELAEELANELKNLQSKESVIAFRNQLLSKTINDAVCTEESHDKIKSLKGIELGLGSVLFSFSGIFLGVEILFMIFICGVKEFQVLSTTMYNIFNIRM